jgi:hypothetical protein
MRRERERNGVRIGQPVRDLDDTSMGSVKRLFSWGFESRRGLPILFGRQFVVRYDELRGVRDGALVVSRSSRDLLDLAAGDVPPSWRITAPPEFPTVATPSEARFVLEDVARGRIPGPGVAAPEVPPAEVAPVTDAEVRTFVDERGQRLAAQHTNRE